VLGVSVWGLVVLVVRYKRLTMTTFLWHDAHSGISAGVRTVYIRLHLTPSIMVASDFQLPSLRVFIHRSAQCISSIRAFWLMACETKDGPQTIVANCSIAARSVVTELTLVV
jgi:hypothetical protein